MDAADTAVWLAQFLFIDGKMRGLFTLLFGAGMALFMDRAWERGQARWLQVRRLLWLGAFGLAHFLFLFWGDILFLYAEAGLAVLPFAAPRRTTAARHRADRWYVAGLDSSWLPSPSSARWWLEQSPAAQVAAPRDLQVIETDWAKKLEDAPRSSATPIRRGATQAEVASWPSTARRILARFPWSSRCSKRSR